MSREAHYNQCDWESYPEHSENYNSIVNDPVPLDFDFNLSQINDYTYNICSSSHTSSLNSSTPSRVPFQTLSPVALVDDSLISSFLGQSQKDFNLGVLKHPNITAPSGSQAESAGDIAPISLSENDYTPPPQDSEEQVDNLSRLYSCQELKCNGRVFANRAGLHRHQREVHGHFNNGRSIQQVFCPNPLCARHKRGFPRRSNLKDHMRRVHSTQVAETKTDSATPPTLSSQLSYSSISLSNPEGMEQFTSTERPQSENGQMIDLPGKLALLKTERARTKQERRVLDDNIRKLDGNIELLEKAMQITLLLPE